MKLLLITAVKAFEKEVKNILKHSGVTSFSLQRVKGYKNNTENKSGNWFATNDIGVDSLLFTVFAECDCTDDIYNEINTFNAKQETLSQIHIAIVQLEKPL